MDAMALLKLSVACTAAGASGDAAGIDDDEPMCMLIQTSPSAQAAKNGSQWSVWIDGSPSLGGISLKHTACTPRSLLRRISAAAMSASHRGTMMSGIRRPPLSPHHSSTIQSLYARMHASPTSLSWANENVCPQNRGKVGNDSDASVQFWSMSASLALGS